ncbi:MAG TPA: 2-succinyl-5-enolpyruvyl-6-hydroxy-3-cyclohexene-1-carboxylic-acid synthase [Myxococcaceae bacterium]|nr:2-succinyl-5-enolpyruvyl-6-hydroxy-3-cyclohexene-1-carboxylic-acid synthase [Myxococcaceae bacterium]
MPSLNTLWARALVQELQRGGVSDVVVCPGSRSAPLALAAAEAGTGVRCWVVLDERVAGFFALGLALESGRPAAVLVTSGSAGTHLFPALVEAWASGLPLVALTADRPWELHGFGAAQTMPQGGLFGRFVRIAESLPVPEASSAAFRHLRAVVSRAVAAATGRPSGPVHLDVPFREPLAPVADAPIPPALDTEALEGRGDAPFLRTVHPAPLPPAPELEAVRRRLAAAERGVVVVGPRARSDRLGTAVHALAASYGYPLLAEAASNVRWAPGQPAVAHLDLLLRNEGWALSARPDLVVRLGGGLCSRRVSEWLDGSGAEVVLVSEGPEPVDPQHRSGLVLEGDAVAICEALTAVTAPRRAAWADGFLRASSRAGAALASALATERRLTEPGVARAVVSALPAGARLLVGSSMPIRDVDAFGPTPAGAVRVLANRGLNGIDGNLSTALGVAAASAAPTVALVGDLAFLHDLGALVHARRAALSLTVVVVNNDGGGIFNFLPIAGSTPRFEALFGTPHATDLSAAAALGGARFSRAGTPSELTTVLQDLGSPGLHVVEARVVDRATNVEVHHALGAAVARALEEGGS